PWAAAGLHAVFMLIQRSQVHRPQVLLSALLLALFVPLGFMCESPINREGRVFRGAGSWLFEHAGPKDRIAAHDRLEQLMFSGGRIMPDDRWVRFGWQAPAGAVVSELATANPQWLVEVSNTRK